MANTFQGLRILTPTTIISNQPSYNTETSNLRTHSVNQGVQRWEATITLMAGGQYNKASTLLPHYLGNGQHTSFLFNIPQPSLIDDGAKDLPTGTLTIETAAVKGATSLTVSVIAGDINKIIPAGRFITFSNHTKVYMVAEEFKPSATTGNTLKLVHPLVSALTTSTTVNYKSDDVNMTAKYSNSNNFSWTLSNTGNTTFTIYLVEDLI